MKLLENFAKIFEIYLILIFSDESANLQQSTMFCFLDLVSVTVIVLESIINPNCFSF